YEIMCSPDQFLSLKTALDSFGVDPSFCELSMIPKNQVELDSEKVVQMEKLISILEDNDDVQNIHHNGVW
ncbi:MAG: YebC/PmpR family DNA-binding transcriptional regulator, partial [Oligoflexales bacterium]|nr:YebC/PmpR family DNA-binding transcriptional regulator [Oligoflexales bacterium]